MRDYEETSYRAVQNLLINCAQGEPGQSLLIVHEASDEGYYDPQLPGLIGRKATNIGCSVNFCCIPFDENVKDPSPYLNNRIANFDHTLFLARLGDQIRFRPNIGAGNRIISYILDRDMLVSDFGIVDYNGFEALKKVINTAIAKADNIRVTCPAGTDFQGFISNPEQEVVDVTVKRFPMSVFTPAPTLNFEGRIAQLGFLTGTGSQYYKPYACEISETLYVEFEGNKISGFKGSKGDIAAAEKHYEFVAKKYGIDPYFMHSWHAGIHPGCNFPFAASESFERWSGGAFGNPRLLHFHSCGKYPPGEISLNMADPSIALDDVAIWENGVLYPERVLGGREVFDQFPSLKAAFQSPARQIGLGKDGRLSFS